MPSQNTTPGTLTHKDLNVPGLCAEQRAALKTLIGTKAFRPRDAAQAYIAAGKPWTDIPRAYAALVRAGRLPDVGLQWRIARIAFREASTIERLKSLARWAETLGPDNWREARQAAAAAAYAAYAADAAYAAAADAAYAAAAYAADAAYAAYAAYAAAAYAAYAAYAADAARNRVRDEIVEMVLTEVERALAEEGK